MLTRVSIPDKLLHRDMGPLSRYLGPYVPKKDPLIWQDPLPKASGAKISDDDVKQLKKMILSAQGVNISSLITTAWGSASTFRISDKRGGANGGRIALEPQRSFVANNPARLDGVLKAVSRALSNSTMSPMLIASSSFAMSKPRSTREARAGKYPSPIL